MSETTTRTGWTKRENTFKCLTKGCQRCTFGELFCAECRTARRREAAQIKPRQVFKMTRGDGTTVLVTVPPRECQCGCGEYEGECRRAK